MVENHMWSSAWHVEEWSERNDTAWREQQYSSICKGPQGSQQEDPGLP